MTRFPFYPAELRNRYETWVREKRFDRETTSPWMPLRKTLRHCKLSLLTASGLRLRSGSPNDEIRRIPIHDLKLGFEYDLEVKADPQVILPIQPMIEAAERREIGELDEQVTSVAFLPRAESIRRLGQTLRADGVDAVLLVPTTLESNETAGRVARGLERAGVSTLTLVTVREVAEALRLPRAAFVNRPFESPIGTTPEERKEIAGALLDTLRRAEKPGRIVDR